MAQWLRRASQGHEMYCLYVGFFCCFFANNEVIITFTTLKFGDVGTKDNLLCHKPHAVLKFGMVGICLLKQSNLDLFHSVF